MAQTLNNLALLNENAIRVTNTSVTKTAFASKKLEAFKLENYSKT